MWWENNRSAREFIELYEQSNSEKTIVLFLGAGITANIYPTWTQLLRKMLDELKKKDVIKDNAINQIDSSIEEGALPEAASDIKRHLGEQEFYTILSKTFERPKRHDSITKRIDKLKKLINNPLSPVWSAVTTNYDSLTSEIGPNPGSIFSSKDPLSTIQSFIKDKSRFLWHLHGDLKDPTKLIFTKEDYDRFIYGDTARIEKLNRLLSENIVLYLGYSLQDQDVKFVLDKIVYENNIIPDKHYLLLPKPQSISEKRKTDARKAELERKNITIIEYDTVDNHRAFDQFIEYLLRLIPSAGIQSFEGYLRNITKQEIIHRIGFQKEIRVQYNDFKNVFFVEIGQRPATKSKRKVSYKEIENTIIAKNERILIVGEAGVGKTTLCRALRKNLSQVNGTRKIIPLIVLLRSKREDMDDLHILTEIPHYKVLDYEHDLTNVIKFNEDDGVKLVLIFDGLNEIDDNSRKKIIPTVNEFSKKFDKISLVFTSRSVGLSEELCKLIDNLKIYEIQRWTEGQLSEYFKNNSVENTDFLINNLSDEMKNALRLPLFAWIFLQARHAEPFQINSISDIFDDFLQKCINPSEDDRQKFRNTKTDYPIDENARIKTLHDLAYSMTKGEALTIACRKIEEAMPKAERQYFRDLVLHLINAGIFRPVDTAIVSHLIDEDTLRSSQVMFLHQALQEYLTARFLQSRDNWGDEVPYDLSNNAFWRDVPHYMMSLINQKKPSEIPKAVQLVNTFLGRHDYLTAARLAKELNVSVKNKIETEVCKQLINNLSVANTYANATSAFEVLGQLGRRQLLDLLIKSDSMEEIIAWPELHLHEPKLQEYIKNKYGSEEDVERIWRKHGRTITILGELNEQKLVEKLLPRLGKIQSTHLKYHVMESFLLVLQANIDDETRSNLLNQIRTKLEDLNWKDNPDRIIAAYSTLFISRNDPREREAIREKNAAQELIDFLEGKFQVEINLHFNNEFWQRAHGFLALAEVADFQDCTKLMKDAIETECNEKKTPYVGTSFQGFKAVLPAIITSILRMQQRLKLKFDEIKDTIETALPKERFGESEWALNRLETLLLNTCSENQKDWLEQWLAGLKQESTKQVIKNIIHSLQF